MWPFQHLCIFPWMSSLQISEPFSVVPCFSRKLTKSYNKDTYNEFCATFRHSNFRHIRIFILWWRAQKWPFLDLMRRIERKFFEDHRHDLRFWPKCYKKLIFRQKNNFLYQNTPDQPPMVATSIILIYSISVPLHLARFRVFEFQCEGSVPASRHMPAHRRHLACMFSTNLCSCHCVL